MVKTKPSKPNTTDNTTNNKTIILGTFIVDSDGEVFIDPTDPLPGLQNAMRYQQIQALRKKLHKQHEQHTPPLTPITHSNRPRQAHSKSKGY